MSMMLAVVMLGVFIESSEGVTCYNCVSCSANQTTWKTCTGELCIKAQPVEGAFATSTLCFQTVPSLVCYSFNIHEPILKNFNHFVKDKLNKVDVLHVRLTELHAAHQNLPPAIRTLRLKETIENIHRKRTKSDNCGSYM